MDTTVDFEVVFQAAIRTYNKGQYNDLLQIYLQYFESNAILAKYYEMLLDMFDTAFARVSLHKKLDSNLGSGYGLCISKVLELYVSPMEYMYNNLHAMDPKILQHAKILSNFLPEDYTPTYTHCKFVLFLASLIGLSTFVEINFVLGQADYKNKASYLETFFLSFMSNKYLYSLAYESPLEWTQFVIRIAKYFNYTGFKSKKAFSACKTALDVANRWLDYLPHDKESELLIGYFHWQKGQWYHSVRKYEPSYGEFKLAYGLYHKYYHELGSDHLATYYGILSSAAIGAAHAGQYGFAELLLKKIDTENITEHSWTAAAYGNLAVLYSYTFSTEDKKKYLDLATSVATTHNTYHDAIDHLDVQYRHAKATNNLAVCEAKLKELIELCTTYLHGHPKHTYALIELGSLIQKKGEDSAAYYYKLLHNSAIPYEKHWMVLYKLCDVELERGDPETALQLIRKAQSDFDKWGTEVHDSIWINLLYANTLLVNNNYSECVNKLMEAKINLYCAMVSIYRADLQKSFLDGISILICLLIVNIAHVLQNMKLYNSWTPGEKKFLIEICSLLLSLKGYVREASQFKVVSDETKPIIDKINNITQQMAVMQQPTKHKAHKFNAEVATLRNTRKELYEKLFSCKKIPDVDLPSITDALPSNSVYVEFYASNILEARMYIAMLIFSNGKFCFCYLGSCDAIAEKIRAVMGHSAKDTRNIFENYGEIDDDKGSFAVELEELTRQLWTPISRVVQSVETIFLSPILDMVHLPFEILPSPANDGTLLHDKHTFNYLSSSRDLLRMASASPTKCNSPPLIIANPNYSLQLPNQQAQQPSTSHNAAGSKRYQFRPLPATIKEGQMCEKLLKSTPVTGDAATVDVVKKCSSPSVLHIASHAVYNNGDPVIAFAGVNSYHEGKAVPLEAEDGLLHAAQVPLLDLRGSFVVLSACETGMCDPYWADSAVGLRGGFLSAGATCIVVSMCPVVDTITARFMTGMYEWLIEKNATVNTAVREMREQLRKEGLPPHDWCAFVVVGNGNVKVKI